MRAATVLATLIPNRFAWNPVPKTESSLDLISTQTPMAFTIRFVNYLFFFNIYPHDLRRKPKEEVNKRSKSVFRFFFFSFVKNCIICNGLKRGRGNSGRNFDVVLLSTAERSHAKFVEKET